jgi:hypothetical protein
MYIPSIRRKRNGIPLLSKDEINNIGEQFVAAYSPDAIKTPMAIDIDDFSQSYLGLRQDYQYLSHNGIYLGMMVFNDTDKIPVYDPSSKRAKYIKAQSGTVIIDSGLLEVGKERKYRFTMGHEVAHDILHSEYFATKQKITGSGNEPTVKCRVDCSRINQKRIKAWSDYEWMEWQADRLSSAILMPASMARKLISMQRDELSAFTAAGWIISVYRKFNVSLQAAEIRLRDLGIIYGISELDIKNELSMFAR